MLIIAKKWVNARDLALSVGKSFGDMIGFDVYGVSEVSDGAGNLDDFKVAAGGKIEGFGSAREGLFGGFREVKEGGDLKRRKRAIVKIVLMIAGVLELESFLYMSFSDIVFVSFGRKGF